MVSSAAQDRTILFGETVLMIGVEAALIQRLGQPIIRLFGPQSDLLQTLLLLQPSLVLFDLADPQMDVLLRLLTRDPYLLIGLDQSSQSALILSSQQLDVGSMDELAQIIQAVRTAAQAIYAGRGQLGTHDMNQRLDRPPLHLTSGEPPRRQQPCIRLTWSIVLYPG